MKPHPAVVAYLRRLGITDTHPDFKAKAKELMDKRRVESVEVRAAMKPKDNV